jgi:hypothetical protein
MRIMFFEEKSMPAKKSLTKFQRQMAWFTGLYISSMLGFGLFFTFKHWLVNILSQ